MTSVNASIMYIEHERKACPAIIDLLNQIGVLIVTDPDDAVNRARASVFDLYLLDDSLLEKSGPDLCGRIRSVDLDASILFFSPELPEPRRSAMISLKRTISRLILESRVTRMKRAESRSVFAGASASTGRSSPPRQSGMLDSRCVDGRKTGLKLQQRETTMLR